MQVNRPLAPWEGGPRYSALSTRVAALKKAGHAADEIVAQLAARGCAVPIRGCSPGGDCQLPYKCTEIGVQAVEAFLASLNSLDDNREILH